MKRSLLCLLILLGLCPALAHAKAKKGSDPPANFRHATYVYVEAVDGNAFNPELLPEDRQAILDVEQGLSAWNRYGLTARRQEADLVFVVRKGRLVTAQARAGIHVGPQQGQASGRSPSQRPNGDPSQNPVGDRAGVSSEIGPPDDLLFVYLLNPDGRLGAQIWMRSLKDGLRSPDVPLFEQVKDAVEKAYPRQTASGKPTP
jgi:hypothetical protein